MDRIVITGIGAVTPLGDDMRTTWAAAARAERAIGPVPHFAGSALENELGGFLRRTGEPGRRGDAALAFAVRAAREALGSLRERVAPARLAIVLGTTMAPRVRPIDELAGELRAALGLGSALVIVVSTACTSGSVAVATGAELLRMGAADLVLAGGTDELDKNSFAGFRALHLLAKEPCTPFGERIGTTLGEGAAFFTLERERDAPAGSIVAVLEATGASADGYHATSPHPSGDGLTRAMRGALAQAGLTSDDIDWVSAHGTGTAANDATEAQAIAKVFGSRAEAIPVSASKSLVGHTLGAAGAVELAIAISAMQSGVVPPMPMSARRAGCALNVPDVATLPAPKRVMKLGAAFGGANAALIVSLPEAQAKAPTAVPARAVCFLGAGSVGGDALFDSFGEAGDFAGRVRGLSFEEQAPGVDPRGLDPTSRLLVVAAHRALQRSNLQLSGAACDQTGLFVGQRRASPASVNEYEASIDTRGLLGAAGSAFTRRVLNTPTGAASRGLSLRGPTITLSTGAGSGLVAIILAAQHLGERDDATAILAGGVDELSDEEDPATTGEGAAIVALGRAPNAGTTGIVLAGWAIGSPSNAGDVATRALASAGLDRDAEVLRVTVPSPASTPAVAGVLAFGRACRAIAGRLAARALVVETGPLAASACVLVAAQGAPHDA